jgi:hypothetical protein
LRRRAEDLPWLAERLLAEAVARFGLGPAASPRPRSPRWPTMTGRAMCASCATASSARRRWPTRRRSGPPTSSREPAGGGCRRPPAPPGRRAGRRDAGRDHGSPSARRRQPCRGGAPSRHLPHDALEADAGTRARGRLMMRRRATRAAPRDTAGARHSAAGRRGWPAGGGGRAPACPDSGGRCERTGRVPPMRMGGRATVGRRSGRRRRAASR